MVSRIKQDSNLIGPEGGVLSSTVVPQVQAVFPEGALTKRIRVGLQVIESFGCVGTVGWKRKSASAYCLEMLFSFSRSTKNLSAEHGTTVNQKTYL